MVDGSVVGLLRTNAMIEQLVQLVVVRVCGKG
jgi:hypothetical protein